MTINKAGGWTITNERHNASPLIGFLPLFASMTEDMGLCLGESVEMEAMIEFSNRHVRMAAIESEWERAGSLTVERLVSSDFANQITDGLTRETLKLNRLGDKLRGFDYSKFTSCQLANLFGEAIENLRKFIVFNNYVNASDFYHELLTRRILECLRISLGQSTAVTADIAYATLTTPGKTVWVQEEEVDLLNILALVQADARLSSLAYSDDALKFFRGIDRVIHLALQEHERKYFWMRYEQEGEVLTTRHFFNALSQLVREGVDAQKALKEVWERRKSAKRNFDEILSMTNLDSGTEHILNVGRQFVYWKLHLREVKVRFYCCMENLMDAIASRLSLDRYQVRHLTIDELISALRQGVEVSAESMNRRMEYCVFHFSKGKTTVYEGKHAKDLFGIVGGPMNSEDVEAVKGVCAFPGFATGYVTQVFDVEDGGKFPRGDVLVAYMTDIGVVPAMKRASAIVTDVGGVTCHASIIAREFGIPCVIGAKIATKALLDGYKVEVNATKGVVTILDKEKRPRPSIVSNVDDQEEDLVDHNIKIPTWKSGLSAGYVLEFERLVMRDVRIAGGKGAALGELVQNGFPVPTGFVILTSAFEDIFFGTDIGSQINQLLSEIHDNLTLQCRSQEIRRLITNMDLPQGFVDEIRKAFFRLGSRFVAVRSSATHEDSGRASWAGQFESFLNTTEYDLLAKIRQCWASLFSDRALLYRAHCGKSSGDIAAAVIVQSMVNSRVSGTAFSAHPITGNADSVLIESCIGLGEALVLGKETPSSFVVEKETLAIRNKEIVEQKTALRRSSDTGNEWYMLSKKDNAAMLTDIEAMEVAALVISIEAKSGFPVDVEWAYDGDVLCLLQSRPITTLGRNSC